MSIISQKKKIIETNLQLQKNKNLIESLPFKEYKSCRQDILNNKNIIPLIQDEVVSTENWIHYAYTGVYTYSLSSSLSNLLSSSYVWGTSTNNRIIIDIKLNLLKNELQCVLHDIFFEIQRTSWIDTNFNFSIFYKLNNPFLFAYQD